MAVFHGNLALAGLLFGFQSADDGSKPIYVNDNLETVVKLLDKAISSNWLIVKKDQAATTTTTDYDLTAITGDGDAAATAFTKLHAIILYVPTEHASGVEAAVGPHPTTNGLVVPFGAAAGFLTAYGPSGGMASPVVLVNNLAAGWTVDSTHKVIEVNPGATATAWRIIFIGE
jgi:hypothetical protein